MTDDKLANGQIRIVSCKVCGAIISLMVANGDSHGDPELHFDYHRKRGELDVLRDSAS